MSIFNFWKKTDGKRATTLETGDVLLTALLNNQNITRKKAMTLPAVSGAVDYICGTVASMPVKLYKKKNGKVEEVEKDPRVTCLNEDTGDTLDGFQFKKAMVEDYLLGQGGYAYVKRRRNEVISLHYVEESNISIAINENPIDKLFVIGVQGKNYHDFEFIKLLRNTKDGASGVGLVTEVSTALETAYRTLLYQLGLVKRGGNKKGFLKSQFKLSQDEIDKLKLAWKNLYANNEENVVVLNNGIEFQESSNTSVEMQLNQNKLTLKTEIDNIFHIYANEAKTFKEAIYPIVRAFETALNQVLLLESEKKAGMFFKFDTKEITKANMKERYDAYKVAKETGFITLNEIRKEENMNYIEGLDVINVGLSAVLYDVKTGTYYTPNTGQKADLDGDSVEKPVENVENGGKVGENNTKSPEIVEKSTENGENVLKNDENDEEIAENGVDSAKSDENNKRKEEENED